MVVRARLSPVVFAQLDFEILCVFSCVLFFVLLSCVFVCVCFGALGFYPTLIVVFWCDLTVTEAELC